VTTNGEVTATRVNLVLAPSAPAEIEEIGLAFVERPERLRQLDDLILLCSYSLKAS
jgi:hypothetical protein